LRSILGHAARNKARKPVWTNEKSAGNIPRLDDIGAIAQPGERNTGSVEVGGSIPPGSTNQSKGSGTMIAAGALENGHRPHRLVA
jgi:hypothetical protein